MIYTHYRTGKEYELVGVAHVEATLDPVVVYRSIETGALWTRPVSEFFEVVGPLLPGKQIRRFMPQGPLL